jgi:transcriptional regulator
MTLYQPTYFAGNERHQIDPVIDSFPFATLISSTSGQPFISHLPLIRDKQENGGEFSLIGHLAIANRHWKLFESSDIHTAIFHGPHAYISPRWYEAQPDNVPTWNYVTVHVSGPIEIISETTQKEYIMVSLAKAFDPDWQLKLTVRDRDAMFNEIVAFRMQMKNVTGKFKLSQNRTDADQKAVIQNLSQSKAAMDQLTAGWMQKTKKG